MIYLGSSCPGNEIALMDRLPQYPHCVFLRPENNNYYSFFFTITTIKLFIFLSFFWLIVVDDNTQLRFPPVIAMKFGMQNQNWILRQFSSWEFFDLLLLSRVTADFDSPKEVNNTHLLSF